MVSRLVLGCGTIGQRIVEHLPARAGQLLVVSENRNVVEALRDDSVPARTGDPTDPTVLNGIEEPAVVLIAGDRTDRNRLTAERARECFPESSLVVYTGGNVRGEDRTVIDRLADRVIDPDRALTERALAGTASDAATKAIALRIHLSALEGPLAVVTHDNPDPDAIASAIAVTDLAASVGLEAQACYFGEISHQENRAMVNVLDLDLRNLDPGESLGEFASFALVDHSRPGVNDQLPEALHVDVVIDHHPPRGPVPGSFVDLREGAGATSTVLTDYLEHAGIAFTRTTATALLYGIRVDTKDFTREASAVDFEAAATLVPTADEAVLRQVESPTVDGDTVDTIARAIKNRTQEGSAVAASAGRISVRDALPQAADQLLTLEGVDTVLVFGFRDEMVYCSARSRASDVDLGEALREAFEPIGSAGGHADMAGAQLEIGSLGVGDAPDDGPSTRRVVEEVLTDRFFEAIQSWSEVPAGGADRAREWLFLPGELDDEGPRRDRPTRGESGE